MKKLLFTAIALAAFSGVSNAKIKKSKIDCECVRESVYNSVIANGGNATQAHYIAQASYNSCTVANL